MSGLPLPPSSQPIPVRKLPSRVGALFVFLSGMSALPFFNRHLIACPRRLLPRELAHISSNQTVFFLNEE